eukprot:TRINITY_DN10609_c0_g2_i2.p1 TRINITY_DN10609_c0_g2~~TRINITY_DN10609_c0_g2_i2.p1  ORF type:complete len:337 (-),score=54.56 TRINITY_DN10609_c0_g2_i2:162-1172(-)
MMCDYALLMSNSTVTGPNGTQLHFRGLDILEASLEKLSTMGLNKATHVLLTGFGHGGTSVFMHADRIGAALKVLSPSLQVYKALPADGIHPKHANCAFWPQTNVTPPRASGDPCNFTDTYTTIVQGGSFLGETDIGIAATAQIDAGYVAGCTGSKCMYVNETYAFTKTPTFVVQQLAGIWDTQCNLAGQVMKLDRGPDVAWMQLECIVGSGSRWHECFQYTRSCDLDSVLKVIAPFQRQYVSELQSTGFHTRPGNGGFMHSCHLGAYWTTSYAKEGHPDTSIWNQIQIGGVSLRAAVGAWWNAPVTIAANFTVDCIWNATTVTGYCNPTCDGFPSY